MEDELLPIPEHAEDRNLYKLFLAESGPPAFVVRASIVQRSWEDVCRRCEQQRQEWLMMVKVRLGTLHALAGDWSNLCGLLSEEQVRLLQELYNDLNPQLRAPIAPTTSRRALQQAMDKLRASIQRFNTRWQKFLPTVDLSVANEARDKYNRYYVLEKECVVRAPHLARRGFTPLLPLTLVDLERQFPLLPVPAMSDT
jgi:hypothetical protein